VISKNEYEYAGIKKAGRKHTHTLIRHYNEKNFDRIPNNLKNGGVLFSRWCFYKKRMFLYRNILFHFTV